MKKAYPKQFTIDAVYNVYFKINTCIIIWNNIGTTFTSK